jgi:hypothetical protein
MCREFVLVGRAVGTQAAVFAVCKQPITTERSSPASRKCQCADRTYAGLSSSTSIPWTTLFLPGTPTRRARAVAACRWRTAYARAFKSVCGILPFVCLWQFGDGGARGCQGVSGARMPYVHRQCPGGGTQSGYGMRAPTTGCLYGLAGSTGRGDAGHGFARTRPVGGDPMHAPPAPDGFASPVWAADAGLRGPLHRT